MIRNYEKITKALATSLGISVDELVSCYDRATAADLSALCELMCQGFGVVENLSQEILAWRYFNHSKNVSDIFVLRYQGALIGAVGAEPIKVKVGDAEYDGIRAGDIVVHPDHMKRGIGAWMNLHLQYKFPVVMAMGSNEKSDTMVRRLFHPVKCRNHFKILFSVKRYLSIRGWPTILISLLSPLAEFCLAAIRKPCLVKIPDDCTVSVSDNTEQLQQFFNNTFYKPRELNIVLRSIDFCRWRYDLNPKSFFTTLCLHQAGSLIGYAIVKNDKAGQNKELQLMDWDLLPDFRNEGFLRVLFSAVVKYAQENEAQSLGAMASDELSCLSLKKTGFSRRALDDGFFLFARADINRDIFNQNNWFLSSCDTDESL